MMKLFYQITALMVLCGVCALASAQTVTWILQDFPPAYIRGNANPVELGSGFQDATIRLLMSLWPEVNHKFVFANSKRTWMILGDKSESCFVGALQTPEREKLAYFTPVAVLPPLQIVVRKDVADKVPLNANGEVLLADLLASSTLKGILVAKRSYAPLVDDAIANRPHADAVSFVQVGNLGTSIPRMLASKRGDYSIEYDFTLNYQRKISYPELEELVTLPIAASTRFVTWNVVCPRSPWGQKTIRHIDSILTQPGVAQSIRGYITPWLSMANVERYKEDMNAFVRRRGKPNDPSAFE